MSRLLVPLLVAAAGCVETLPPIEETTSLAVELVAPTDPGAPDRRLDPSARDVMIRVTAKDAQNQLDTGFTGPVQVYVQFLGALTPALGSPLPFATIELTAGVSPTVSLTLPAVFGPTTLWIEDGGEGATYATGSSVPLWYPDPHVADISTPRDLMALDALAVSPLQNRQVTVSSSRYGDRGRLVVTGTYAQGYSVSDVECADAAGTPPCVAGDFDHVLVFSFSRPKDEQGRNIEAGQFIDGFAGAVSEFNGLTEMSFPQSFITDTSADVARIPAPAVVNPSWFTNPIEFEKHESGLIAIDNGTVCPLDADYTTYKQWKIDVGRGCGSAVNVITSGVIEFDPASREGLTVARVVGVLRPVNIGSFNVFIIYPRFSADLVL
ncbi:MAG: hypothetical protein IPL61_09640 [Myxococcales bacterium]|nr:hypothetical protein [Myxococcales bacterium]